MSAKRTEADIAHDRQIAAATSRALNYISSGRTEKYKAERENIRTLQATAPNREGKNR